MFANFLIFETVGNATKNKENYEVQNFKAIMESKRTLIKRKRVPYM